MGAQAGQGYHYPPRGNIFLGRGLVANNALSGMGKNDMVVVESASRQADLSTYPVLDEALAAYYIMDKDRREEIREGEERILRWYEVVTRSMRSVFGSSPYYKSKLYKDEAKVAAVWLLGEYRDIYGDRQLAVNVDLRDEEGVTESFTGRLKPAPGISISGEYPVAVAILKIGPLIRRQLEEYVRSHEAYKISDEGASRLQGLLDIMNSHVP